MGAARQLAFPTHVDHITEAAIARDRLRPDVFAEFKTRAVRAQEAGVVFGAKALAEQIRWSRCIEKGDRDFVINNSDVSCWARWAARDEPTLEGYFRFRVRTAR